MDYKGMPENFGHLYYSLLQACPADMSETDRAALAYQVAELEQTVEIVSESMSLLRVHLRKAAEKPVESWNGISAVIGNIDHLCEHAHNVRVRLQAIRQTLEGIAEVRKTLELDDDSP